ncbi:MAG: hypothetical protein M1820_000809 [Bogoriella megaspora]|nr:MAG: hypothetical protein M1820_000809 [Bogoriella megaspora]
MGVFDSEFPLLSGLGLYAADIKGDGNCLFNALSDQLYGDQGKHQEIRATVIEYMKVNGDYYKQFIDVHPGGGTRRNPKRKTASTHGSNTDSLPPSATDIDRVFESHLQRMAKGGTYGDNMEVSAFSQAYDVHVKIYQRDFAFMIPAPGEGNKPVAHIAYHTWEHYSSIRNLSGPHTGLPEVQARAMSSEEEQKQKDKLAETSYTLPWMIEIVQKSIPFLSDKPTIKKMLDECKGDVNAAVSKFLELEEQGSISSTQESSSIERDPDSDDELSAGPSKKQDRRMSRASKAEFAKANQYRQVFTNFDGSQDSFDSEMSEVPADSEKRQPVIIDMGGSSDEEDVPVHKSTDGTRGSSSEASSQPRLRILINGKRSDGSSRSSSVNPRKLSPDRVNKTTNRTQQKQLGPQHHRGPSAAQRKQLKKQAQKAARKERAKMSSKKTTKAATPSSTPTPPPMIDGIKTLYI